MSSTITNIASTPETTRHTTRGLYASGIWLRVAFIGASGFAAGLIQLFEGSANQFLALALAVGGAAFAAFSWWRAKASLDNIVDNVVDNIGPGEERVAATRRHVPTGSTRAIAGM